MTIKRMTAVFGCLDGETLHLHEGLNVLRLPNEGGKSTWCAFLRAMLYGIPTRERDKEGYLAEKNRYQPWSGRPMEGELTLDWNGREITLRRASRANSPFGVFEAVYTGTDEPVPGLTRESAGEVLTGVTREVLERTAFVGQGAVALSGGAELERRVAALMVSGEEDVSFTEAEQRLRNWRNARQSNTKTGAIPRLEAEQAALRETLTRLESARERESAAREEAERQAARRELLERELSVHRRLAQTERRARYEAAKAELLSARAAERAAAENLTPAPVPPVPPPEAAQTMPGAKRGMGAPALILAGLAAVSAVAAVLLNWMFWVAAGALAASAAALWSIGANRARRDERAAQAAAEARRRALAEYEQALRAYDQDTRAAAERAAAVQAVRAAAAHAAAVVETMERDGIPESAPAGLSAPRRTQAETEAECRAAAAALERAEREAAAAAGEAAGVGDESALRDRAAAIRGELSGLRGELSALNLAMDCLTAANAAVQERFSPRLNALAGEVLAALTGGGYTGMTLKRDFTARVRAADELTLRPAIALSRGTADQIYLALRLALCGLTLEKSVPLILDDALVNFDDTRMAYALEYLNTTGRQVLLLTCQSREAAWLAARPCNLKQTGV